MRFLTCSAVMVAFLGLTLVGCKSSEEREADKKVVQDELDKLQGKWKIASREGDRDPDGEEDKDKSDKGLVITIDKDVMSYAYDGEVSTRRKMTLRPTKDPKEIDLVYVDEKGKEITTTKRSKVTSGKKKGKEKVKTTSIKEQGIYKLDGDKLTLCIAWDEKDRPTDFTTPPGSFRNVTTLQKIKGTGSETSADEKNKDSKETAAEKKVREDKEKADKKANEKKADDKKADEKKADGKKPGKKDDEE